MCLHGKMWCCVGQIQKKGGPVISLNEIQCLFCELFCQIPIHKLLFDHLITTPDLTCLVVAFVNVIRGIKSLTMGPTGQLAAQMPLSRNPGCVTRFLEYLCHGNGPWMQTFTQSHLVTDNSFFPAHANGITTGQQCHSGRRTNRRS